MFKKKKNRLSVTKEHRIAIIVVVLNCLIISGLGVNAYLVNAELRHLKNQMTYLSDTSNVILSGVDTMRDDIEKTLQEEASLIEDWSIERKSTNFAMGTYNVSVTVIPKEYTEKTQVEIYFGTNKFKLTPEKYKYVGEVQLSMNHRFDGNVTVLLINGKKKNTEVLSGYQDIQSSFEDVLTGSLKEIPKFEDGVLRVNQDFSYDISDKNQYGFTQFELVIEANGKELDAFDLLADVEEEKTDVGEEKDTRDKPETGVEDQTIDSDPSKEKLETDTEEPVEELPEPVYMLNGAYHVKEHYDVKEGAQIRIYLRAVCEEGFTFTYDLFRGITEEGAVKGFSDAEDYFAPNARVYDALGYWSLD